MSTAFTTPGDASWQTLLDEITLAYSERRQALGSSSYTAIDGRDVSAAGYWNKPSYPDMGLQYWLETSCTAFINHVTGPLSGSDLVFFTLDSWQEEAGLNRSAVAGESFRRAAAWDGVATPTWEYGFMQAGDIIGPWIFEDIQKGFGALKWSENSYSYIETIESFTKAKTLWFHIPALELWTEFHGFLDPGNGSIAELTPFTEVVYAGGNYFRWTVEDVDAIPINNPGYLAPGYLKWNFTNA
jgi:hypothetical protein